MQIFPYDNQLIQKIKKIESARWSYSSSAWLVDFDEKSRQELVSLFPGLSIKPMNRQDLPGINRLDDEKKALVQKFVHYLSSKRYSPNTISVYSNAIRTFLVFNENKPIRQLVAGDLTL